MPKPKPVNWQYDEHDQTPRQMVLDLIQKYHQEIVGVVPVVMWRHNIKMDPDGYVWLADVSKTPDKYRELHEHDVVIGINKDAWSVLDDQQRNILLDSQLERIAVAVDKKGVKKEDDRSRTIYRLRKEKLVDDHVLQRRHSLSISDVQEYVSKKFTIGDAEEGSYVAEQLTT